jgi:RNA polymerase sigma-70 factor (ECF subfamily)
MERNGIVRVSYQEGRFVTISDGQVDPRQDGDAYAALVRPLLPVAFRVAYGLLRDRGEAEDVVQDAMLLGWTNLQRLRDLESFRPWVLRIVVNRCHRVRRNRWWRLERLALLPEDALLFARDDDGALDIARALDGLDRQSRTLVILRFYADLSYDEVAAVTGLPVGTVKSRLHRVLRGLRPRLQVVEQAS